ESADRQGDAAGRDRVPHVPRPHGLAHCLAKQSSPLSPTALVRPACSSLTQPHHCARPARREVTALTAAWSTITTAPAITNHFNKSHEAPISTSLPPYMGVE